jgi:hypothetical protein
MDLTDTGSSFTANLGHELLIQRITLSSDQDAVVRMTLYPGIFNPYGPSASSVPQSAVRVEVVLKAGTPWDWYPDGSVSLVRGRINQFNAATGAMNNEGTITVSAKAITTAGNIYYSINGVEVARGDL